MKTRPPRWSGAAGVAVTRRLFHRVVGFAGADDVVTHAGVVGLMTVMFWSWSTKKGGSVEPPFRLVTRSYSGVTPWTVSIVFRGDRLLPTRQ
jgi:hypothetical protein